MPHDEDELVCPEYLAYCMLGLVKQIAELNDDDFNVARDMAEQAATILSRRISEHDRETRLKSL